MKRLIILFLTLTTVLTLSSCGKDDEIVEYDVPNEYSVNMQELPYIDYLSNNNPVVTIEVQGIGNIVIQLFPDVAPNTVNNFIQYVQDGDYAGNEFHRVIDGFVIQGGQLEDPCPIEGEFSSNGVDNDLLHDRGVISMARVGSDYNSGSSQFFIMHAGTYGNNLDTLYASFGGVIQGFNVLDFIAAMQIDENNEIPYATVTITDMSVELNGYVPADRVCYVSE